MKKLFTFLMMAAGLLIGTQAWADNVGHAQQVGDVAKATFENGGTSVTLYYATIDDALTDIGNADNKTGEIVLINGVNFGTYTVSYAINIPAGDIVTLDLNGNTINGINVSGGTSALIFNEGKLTIKDSNKYIKGRIVCAADPSWVWDGSDNYSGSYASNAITNHGTLEVSDISVANSCSDGSAAYAIDAYKGSVVINSGEFTAAKANAIRLFPCKGAPLSVTINGGTFTSGHSRAIQIHSGGGVQQNLTIHGGEFIQHDDDNLALYVYNGGGSFAYTYITIDSGTFHGDVAATSAMPTANISITGGKFGGSYGAYSYSGSGQFITGGIYTGTYWSYFLKDGYAMIYNTDEATKAAYPYTVGKAPYELYYEFDYNGTRYYNIEWGTSVADAISIAEYRKAHPSTGCSNYGDFQIYLTEDCNEDFELPVGYYFCTDGHNYTGTMSAPTYYKTTSGTYGDNNEYTYYKDTVDYSAISGTAYAGNSIAIAEESVEAFETLRKTCPNAVLFVEEDVKNLISDQVNVIYKHTETVNGSSTDTYFCPIFKLADKDVDKTKRDFYTPFDFVAQSGSYERSLYENYNTCCVPFALKSSVATIDNDDAKYLTFWGYRMEGSTKIGVFNDYTELTSQQPCLIYVSSDATLTATFNNTPIVKNEDIAANVNLKGTYTTNTTWGTTKDMYSLVSSGLYFGTCAASTVYAFRGVLDMHDARDISSQQAPGRISYIGLDALASTVTELNEATVNMVDQSIYTVDGKMVGKQVPATGLYIVNGKVYFIRK